MDDGISSQSPNNRVALHIGGMWFGHRHVSWNKQIPEAVVPPTE